MNNNGIVKDFLKDTLKDIFKKIVIVAIIFTVIGGAVFAVYVLKEKGVIFNNQSKIVAEPETIYFQDFEISFNNVEIIGNNGKDYIEISTTVTNTGDKSERLSSFFNLIRYDTRGIEIDETIFNNFDDDIDNIGKMRANSTIETFIYIPYTKDGDYYLEFKDLFSKDPVIEVKIPVKK